MMGLLSMRLAGSSVDGMSMCQRGLASEFVAVHAINGNSFVIHLVYMNCVEMFRVVIITTWVSHAALLLSSLADIA